MYIRAMKTLKNYRLPNGKYTSSVEVYLRGWRKLARIVEKHLNVQVTSYNPDFGVCSKEGPYGRLTAHIPLWLALSIQRQHSAL